MNPQAKQNMQDTVSEGFVSAKKSASSTPLASKGLRLKKAIVAGGLLFSLTALSACGSAQSGSPADPPQNVASAKSPEPTLEVEIDLAPQTPESTPQTAEKEVTAEGEVSASVEIAGRGTFDDTPARVEATSAVGNDQYLVVPLKIVDGPKKKFRLLDSGVGITIMDLKTKALSTSLNDKWQLRKTKVGEQMVLVFPANKDIHEATIYLDGYGVISGIPVKAEASSGTTVAKLMDGVKLAKPDDLKKAVSSSIGSVIADLDGNDVVEISKNNLTLNLSSDIGFAVDSADLSDKANQTLQSAVDNAKIFKSGGSITVVGHTDDVADDAYNLDLSKRRAKAVGDKLHALGLPQNWQVATDGKGESEPRVPNDSDNNRALNRRVEIRINPVSPDEATTGFIDARAKAPLPPAPQLTATGPEGLKIVGLNDHVIEVKIPQLWRKDGYLFGPVKLNTLGKKSTSVAIGSISYPSYKPGFNHWDRLKVGNVPLALLSGELRYFPLEFKNGKKFHVMTPFNTTSEKDNVWLMWPDPGSDNITVDSVDPRGHLPSWRLTNIPVKDLD
ncbi:hypothetical protein BK816_01245 [Boudabousia tangfeifanii]|uniref:OmpA-like domain-containing protein n=1 Tax=Boudabousia tangfeifanii TaxID=1912795 RepID=A0A1D9MIR2_9ACTO|nr:OmpA family protein [Boudabousia tangfeifanii]AOZ72088.1 hypothetical protein BK816_01245 [Boudabousia tangfeifanii]